MALTDDIRAAAARVAAVATHVRIDEAAIERYAPTLDEPAPPHPDIAGDDETRAAFSLQLNAINFGSGWFPTLRKRPGMSGFRTMEAGLTAHGPWTARQLRAITREEIAQTMGQDPGHELMRLYETALREIGAAAGDAGGFARLARAGNGSAERLAELLAELPTWHDASAYGEEAHEAPVAVGAPVAPPARFSVPLFKRAQIAAADLALQGLAPAGDLQRLTLFADNLVPHVLKLDGILHFDPELDARIEAEHLLVHGSPEEVEIRAVALHAVELLVQAHGATTATAVDNLLWNRGAGPRYKARPRHRARTTAY